MQTASEKNKSPIMLPRVIAISSGKGGVGKSSIAVNLGISLAKHGARVCLLDADTGLANVNILLGVTPQYSLEHVLYGTKPIDEVMVNCPHDLKLIPGANGISECVALHPRQQLRMIRELSRIEKDFDYLLIDTAAGIGETTLDFITAAQYSLIVITPEPTSLTDAFSLIKLLKRRRGGIHYRIVVNMCKNGIEAKEVFQRFAAAVEKYVGIKLHFLGYVPRDESVRAAVSLQRPVAMFPDTDPSCQSFNRLAEALQQSTQKLPTNRSFSSYWHRHFKIANQLESEQEEVAAVQPVKQGVEQLEKEYMSELRSRFLLMIEKGQNDQALIEQILRESVAAYMEHYQECPLDLIGLIEQMILFQNRDDHQLREVYTKVKPWGAMQAPMVITASDMDAIESEQLQTETHDNEISGGSPIAGSSTSLYDETRFGSQEQLLQRIKAFGDGSASLASVLAFATEPNS